jgi:arabinosyltransferase C
MISGVVTIVGALFLPLAPVRVEDPTVSWPLVPTAPRSTLLSLESGRPLGLQARFSCQAVAEASAASASRASHVLFATTDPDQPERADGLRIIAGNGTLTAYLGGTEIFRDSVPAGACHYDIVTRADQLDYFRDGVRLGNSPLPDIDALITAVTALPGPDLQVTVRVDNRFASSPTPMKCALMALLAISSGVAIWCLFGMCRKRRKRVVPRPEAADILVGTAVVAWLFLAPMTHDDGWMYTMAVNQRYAGYFGNYYMYHNNSYVPFTWLLWIYSWWVGVGTAPVLMRVPSLVFAVITWLGVRATVLPFARGPRMLIPALLFLAWWLPFGLSTRQEASVAACLTVTTYAIIASDRRQQPAYLARPLQ